MNYLESYLVKKILPYDRRIKDLTRSLEAKDIELEILSTAYENLLNELEGMIGSNRFASYVQKLALIPDEDDLTDEEKMIILKLFDFNVLMTKCDSLTSEKLKWLKKCIQDSDFNSLMSSPLLQSLVKSPDFSLLINHPNFRDLMKQERLISLVKTPEFKELVYNPNFKNILAKNGLYLPLRPFDLQLSFRMSILKSIAKLERIFEDFRVNRCAEYSPPKIRRPVRSSLSRSLSPRRTSCADLNKSGSFQLQFSPSKSRGDISTNEVIKIQRDDL